MSLIINYKRLRGGGGGTCHGEITPRKETFVQSRVYDVIRDSREHVEKRKRIRTAMLA